MRLHLAHRSAYVAVAAVALLCLFASCGTTPSESQPSPPATTAAPTADATAAACEDVEALKSSLEALTKVRPAEDGVANVKTSLDKAEASASPVLQPSVQQVKTAFGELQTAASGLTGDNLRQKAPAIASAIKDVTTATQALSTKVNESCPGS
jgi:hypothetical protein